MGEVGEGDSRRISSDDQRDDGSGSEVDDANRNRDDTEEDKNRNGSADMRMNEASLTLLYTNAQSLVNKVNEMKAVTAINNPDLLIVTETWTNEAIADEYLNIDGYDIIERKDRNDTLMGRGGGIVVYAKKDLYAWKVKCDTMFNQCGMIGVKRNNRDLYVLAVYRSPNSTKTNDDNLCAWIERMRGKYVIVGDLNFPDIKWQTGCAGSKGRRFLETITDKFLKQHVESATHDSGNVLDLIISSEDELVRDVEMIGKIGKSDHAMIKCVIDTDVVKSNNATMRPNYNRANCVEMRRMMRKNWREELEGKTVNEMWSVIKKSLENTVTIHVPLKKKKRTDEPKWLDAEMRQKINSKRRAWTEWKRTGRATERAAYDKEERECKKMIKNKKNALERSIAKNRTSNPKMYFSYINSAKRNRSRIGPLKNDNGEFIIKAKDQAETMSDFFSSVFTRSDGEPPAKNPINGNESLTDIEVTEEQVKKLIDGLREYAAPGPDGFPPKLLQILVTRLLLPCPFCSEDRSTPDKYQMTGETLISRRSTRKEVKQNRVITEVSV